ncbi:CAP domain-containing protein [Salinilacustrithrix flava]|uniref:CAP domain-containing protein n=1 Tax=Salinilacustrithrix flava TaxID=2957203 RepID=UPI003D7C20C9
MHIGGRSTRRLVALGIALALLLGACGGSDADVASDGDRPTEQRDRERERDRDGDPDDEDSDDEVAAATTSSTTSTTTTTTTTTTTVPPTTAAPTTQPPPPPTTAPPPPPPPTTAPPPPPSGPRNGTRNTGCEQYMYNQINAARANAGRGGLTFDTGIQYIAVGWSDEMSGSQTLRHNPNYGDQIVRHRDYRTAGENVGRGYEQGSLFQAFMNSPGHRANIESTAYSHVTVGCLTDAGGQLWVTQNFWGS